MYIIEKNKSIITDTEFRLNWLFKEIELLEHKIEFFDSLFFKIKNWAIVSWFALISLAITEFNWLISTLSLFIPILFAIIEASYKRIQIEFIKRTRNIMKFLNKKEEFQKWTNGNELHFPIYDLLNIYCDNKTQYENPTTNRWDSMFRSIKKVSVSIVYYCLCIGSIITSAILFISEKN